MNEAPTTRTQKSWPVTRVLDIPVDCLQRHSLEQAVLQQLKTPQNPWQIVTMNAEMAYAASQDPDFMAILQQADMIIPDGIGVVWALSHQGVQVPRLPGVELVEFLFSRAEAEGFSIGILGSHPDTLAALQQVLQERYGQVPLCFIQNGYFKPEEEAQILEELQRARPDVLLVALGVPRQEAWIAEHRASLNIPVMMGIGGSLDVISGRLERAPQWMRQAHLEWLFRLYQQPSRWRRMLALPRFVRKIIQS